MTTCHARPSSARTRTGVTPEGCRISRAPPSAPGAARKPPLPASSARPARNPPQERVMTHDTNVPVSKDTSPPRTAPGHIPRRRAQHTSALQRAPAPLAAHVSRDISPPRRHGGRGSVATAPTPERASAPSQHLSLETSPHRGSSNHMSLRPSHHPHPRRAPAPVRSRDRITCLFGHLAHRCERPHRARAAARDSNRPTHLRAPVPRSRPAAPRCGDQAPRGTLAR